MRTKQRPRASDQEKMRVASQRMKDVGTDSVRTTSFARDKCVFSVHIHAAENRDMAPAAELEGLWQQRAF